MGNKAARKVGPPPGEKPSWRHEDPAKGSKPQESEETKRPATPQTPPTPGLGENPAASTSEIPAERSGSHQTATQSSMPLIFSVRDGSESAAHVAADEGNAYNLEAALYEEFPPYDSAQRTPLFYAAARDYYQCCALLLDWRSDLLDLADAEGNAPTHVSAQRGSGDCLTLLLQSAADPNLRNHAGQTPCHLASTRECLEILQAFDADFSASDSAGRTALHASSALGRRECCALLLQSNHRLALLQARDSKGDTAMHAAARSGHHNVVELLISSGGIQMVHERNVRGFTPSDLAKSNNHATCVAVLSALASAMPQNTPPKPSLPELAAQPEETAPQLQPYVPSIHYVAAASPNVTLEPPSESPWGDILDSSAATAFDGSNVSAEWHGSTNHDFEYAAQSSSASRRPHTAAASMYTAYGQSQGYDSQPSQDSFNPASWFHEGDAGFQDGFAKLSNWAEDTFAGSGASSATSAATRPSTAAAASGQRSALYTGGSETSSRAGTPWETRRKRASLEDWYGEWTQYEDPDSGRPFWWNAITGACQWDAPEGAKAPEDSSSPRPELEDDESENGGLSYESEAHHIRQRSYVLEQYGDWMECKDPVSGDVYFYDSTTGECEWELPPEIEEVRARKKQEEEAKIKEDAEKEAENWVWTMRRRDEFTGGKKKRNSNWSVMQDGDSGAVFYVNKETGESTWEEPEDFNQGGESDSDDEEAALAEAERQREKERKKREKKRILDEEERKRQFDEQERIRKEEEDEEKRLEEEEERRQIAEFEREKRKKERALKREAREKERRNQLEKLRLQEEEAARIREEEENERIRDMKASLERKKRERAKERLRKERQRRKAAKEEAKKTESLANEERDHILEEHKEELNNLTDALVLNKRRQNDKLKSRLEERRRAKALKRAAALAKRKEDKKASVLQSIQENEETAASVPKVKPSSGLPPLSPKKRPHKKAFPLPSPKVGTAVASALQNLKRGNVPPSPKKLDAVGSAASESGRNKPSGTSPIASMSSVTHLLREMVSEDSVAFATSAISSSKRASLFVQLHAQFVSHLDMAARTIGNGVDSDNPSKVILAVWALFRHCVLSKSGTPLLVDTSFCGAQDGDKGVAMNATSFRCFVRESGLMKESSVADTIFASLSSAPGTVGRSLSFPGFVRAVGALAMSAAGAGTEKPVNLSAVTKTTLQRLLKLTVKWGTELPARCKTYRAESQLLAKDSVRTLLKSNVVQLKFLYIYCSRRLKVKKKSISFADFAHFALKIKMVPTMCSLLDLRVVYEDMAAQKPGGVGALSKDEIPFNKWVQVLFHVALRHVEGEAGEGGKIAGLFKRFDGARSSLGVRGLKPFVYG